MVKGGYVGKILRIDMTTGAAKAEPLPDESVLRKYLGGFGLGMWYLMRELPKGIDPLDPRNPLIFMNGPLTATRAPCPTNCTITTFNLDTAFTAGRTHSHGWFGVYMRQAGYDGMIITGASDKWVYIYINNDKIEFRDASKLLGKDTHETEDLVKQELGFPIEVGKGVSVATIGVAGENLVGGTIIENDKNHSFSHAGVGSILGSKKVKAIAISGTGEVPLADKEKFSTVAKEWVPKAATEGVRGSFEVIAAGDARPRGGAIIRDDYKAVKGLLGLSANNFLKNTIPGFGERWSKQKLTPRPCFRCPIGCCLDVDMLEGAYKGSKFTLSGGGENIEGAASIVGIGGSGDPGETLYMADLYDKLGLETSTGGCSMAVAFEAYEKGLITTKDTDGLELKWGNAQAAITLLNRIARKEGKFAIMLGDGPKATAERLGIPDAAVHVKGTGINLHDWRVGGWSIMLSQIVGGGTGWASGGADCWGPEADVGYPQMTQNIPFGKGEEVAKTTMLKMYDDSIGTCWFSTWGLPGQMKYSSSAIAAATGWEGFDPEEALQCGHRILTLERIFNMAHGLTAEDDINVSIRLVEAAPADAPHNAGVSIAPFIEGWVRDYYQYLGWNRKTGKPLAHTLEKLGLEEFAPLVGK